MENKIRITLAHVDRLDDGAFERLVEEARKTTSDEREVEELTTLNILRNFSQRLKKDKKGESSSNPRVSSRQEVGIKKMKMKFAEMGSDPRLNLPDSLRAVVARKGGTHITMVIMKKLKKMDMDTKLGGLTIKVSKIKEANFLTEEEKKKLDLKNEEIDVTLIQPCHKGISLGLKRWPKSPYYLLNGRWISVIRNKKNGLKKKDIVQLWSFRTGSNLGFVLVKVCP